MGPKGKGLEQTRDNLKVDVREQDTDMLISHDLSSDKYFIDFSEWEHVQKEISRLKRNSISEENFEIFRLWKILVHSLRRLKVFYLKSKIYKIVQCCCFLMMFGVPIYHMAFGAFHDFFIIFMVFGLTNLALFCFFSPNFEARELMVLETTRNQIVELKNEDSGFLVTANEQMKELIKITKNSVKVIVLLSPTNSRMFA